MTDDSRKRLLIINLGLTRYRRARQIQKAIIARRREHDLPDCLIITEHHPVITMGRGTRPANLLVSPERLARDGIDLVKIERGGDITFHGPGQVILYPIIDLNHRARDMHRFLRDMEAFTIAALASLGLAAGTKEGLTGVWLDDHKIGAVGVAVSRWFTYHGLALNVDVNLDYFRLINPCGITDYPVGNITDHLDHPVTLDEVSRLLTEKFADHFGYTDTAAEPLETILPPGRRPRYDHEKTL